MLQTLPLVLFIVMTEVSIGSFSVLVLLDWRNEVKRGFLTSYALLYLGLTALTYLFQQNFSTPELLATYAQLDAGWARYQTLPLALFLLLIIPYNVLLWLDQSAGRQERKPQEGAQPSPRPSLLRILRLSTGGATIAAGLATLLVMAMVYRPLAAATVGGVFTVAGFFAAAFALGGVLTAMWLGHWYLVTPALSEKPLQFSTTIVLVALIAQVLFTVLAGPSTVHARQPSTPPAHSSLAKPSASTQLKPGTASTLTPLGTEALGWIRILVAFLMPVVLTSLAWKLIRDRSFQSATGMLYLVVVCSLAGEIMARGLFLVGL